MMNEYVVTK